MIVLPTNDETQLKRRTLHVTQLVRYGTSKHTSRVQIPKSVDGGDLRMVVQEGLRHTYSSTPRGNQANTLRITRPMLMHDGDDVASELAVSDHPATSGQVG